MGNVIARTRRQLAAVVRALREETGQSFAETALMLPLIAVLLVGGADIARVFAVELAVQNGARAGAESAAIVATPTQPEAEAQAKQEIARTPGLDPNAAQVNMSLSDAPGGTTPCAPPPPTIANPCWVTVRVQYTFTTIVRWPLLPNVFTFERSTSFRRFS